MGKNWKQKSKAGADRITDFKWSSQSYSLKEILQNFKLPIVVQCREETRSLQLDESFFDLRQPLLLFTRRNARKIFSRCVRRGQGGTLKELSPEVVIPEDYAGWFKVSTDLTFSKPVPHHTIQSVYESPSEFFLCTTTFKVLLLSPRADSVSSDSASTRAIVEGEVLRKTGVHTVNQMMIPESERDPDVGNRYLMCIDEKDGEVLIPLTQSGLFYEVSDGSFEKGNCVMQVRDILDEMLEFPLYVRHVLGDPPPVSKFYSPCLKLVRVLEEETVMGATLDKDDLMPLEIQTSSEIKFEIALNTAKVQSSIDYLEALDLCNTVAQFYVTDMKLAVNYVKTSTEEAGPSTGHDNLSFVPDDLEAPTSLTNSLRTSYSAGPSELGDVDANSEFHIKWAPGPQMSSTFRRCREPVSFDTDTDDQRDSSSLDNNKEVLKLDHVLGGRFLDGRFTFDRASSPSVGLWQKRHFSDTELCNWSDPVRGGSTTSNGKKHRRKKDRSVTLSDDTLTISRRAEVSTVEEMTVKPVSPNLDADDDCVVCFGEPDNAEVCRTKIIDIKEGSGFDEDTPQYDGMDLSSPENTPRDRYAKASSLKRNPLTNLKADMYGVKGGLLVKENTHQVPDECESVVSDSDLSDLSSVTSGSSCADDNEPIKVSQLSLSSERGYRQNDKSDRRNNSPLHKLLVSPNHQEQAWQKFCLERSASLPVTACTKPMVDSLEEHSHSWEQIGVKSKSLQNRTLPSEKNRDLSKSIARLNEEFIGDGDRTQLILETSSDESIRSYSLPLSLSSSEVDVYDSAAERKATSLLAAVNETVLYLDGVGVDADVHDTERRMAAEVAQAMKIKHEIKRKKLHNWNDECSEI